MDASLCVQDHVVLLLSPQDFQTPPSWLSENFNILEGGVHAGCSTIFYCCLAITYQIHRQIEPEQAHSLRRWILSGTLLLARYTPGFPCVGR